VEGHVRIGTQCTRTTLDTIAVIANGCRRRRTWTGRIVAWLPTTVAYPFTDDSGTVAPLFKLRFEDGPIKGEHSIFC